jgi:hypothetical protein
MKLSALSESFFKKIPVMGVLLAGLLVKSIIFDPSLPLAIITVAMAGLYGFIQHVNSKKVPEINVKVMEEIKLIKNQVSSLQMASGLKRLDGNEQKTTKRFF